MQYEKWHKWSQGEERQSSIQCLFGTKDTFPEGLQETSPHISLANIESQSFPKSVMDKENGLALLGLG